MLARKFDGYPVTYLDSAATSQTPQPVIDAMTRYYTESRASIHRGVYPLAVEATDLFRGGARADRGVAGIDPEETIFTSNATAAINLVAYTWAAHNVNSGDLVVLTEMEHHSNIVPWQLLCQDRDAELAYVPVLDDGQLDLDPRPAARALAEAARAGACVERSRDDQPRRGDRPPRAQAGAVVLVDGSQAIPQIPVDLRELDVDFYAWTGHKAYGPTGIGVLHGRQGAA